MAQLSDDCFAFGGPMMSVDEAVGIISARVAAVKEAETVSLRDAEPLAQECRHFLECIETRQRPRTDGRNGVEVLRVLQEREFERVGGTHPIHVDVRLIAATNRDLQTAVENGTFRQDLFYRLNVFPLEVPPLRERREDIPVLVQYLIARYARKTGKTIRRVNKRTFDLLQSYRWPGNVRELQNVIERSVIVCNADEFTVDDSWLSAPPGVEKRLAPSGTFAAQEKAIIEDALRATGGRVYGPSGAAERLGIPRSTLEKPLEYRSDDR